MIQVRYHRGLELPAFGLWLDPADQRPFAFVSHAHSDHIGAHAEVIASTATARLMAARLPGKRREHLLPFGAPTAFPGFTATLLPAGHIFGSAQLFLESDEGTLLYTGDFKLRPSLSAEPAQWRHADILIMETTYGLPKYRMPPTEEVIARMIAFCQETLEEGAVPVLLGYSLGKSQEILCALLQAGLVPMLHGSVFRMTEVYRELRPDFPDGYLRYSAGKVEGKVLVCPPSVARSPMLQRIKHRRTAVLTGWALDPGAKYRYGCDDAFPLTDHADYTDLVRYVELVQPKLIYTLHGFAGAFARDLRQRGFEAWALTEENQLELLLQHPAAAKTALDPSKAAATLKDGDPADPVSVSPPPTELTPQDFALFARLGQQLASTGGKLQKIELLAAYLARLAALDVSDLAAAAVYLTGRAFPQKDARVLQIGWAVIARALQAVSRKPEAEVRAIARTHGDAGRAACEILLDATQPEPFSLGASGELFAALQSARGPLQKTELLQQRLSRLDPLSASFLIRILTGDLRIGLKEGLVEEAIASAFSADPSHVREANMLLGDIGRTAKLAARGALAEASLEIFQPIKCMLASPEPTADAIWSRLCDSRAAAALPMNDEAAAPPAFWLEEKYDGIRAQLHADAARIELFSRDLHRITDQFGDLVRDARGLFHRVILDGEIVAYEAGRRLTFFDLQKRLGRKREDDLFLGRGDIPVIFKAFDLLWLEGASLLREPLTHRRRLLEGLSLPAGLERVPIINVDSSDAVEAAFQAARAQGNEGLIAKDGASLYTPGRRGLAWLKLKKELATLDVVVVGAEAGHGKRAGVLSDYTFAVREDATGLLLTIGKAYSGLTDEEIEELTEHFLENTLRTKGRYREVRPEIVLEIAFDSVQPSDRHESGLALRFPRIKAIRRDKTVADIDPLSYARSLAGRP